jgi:hypothetical protein
VRDGHRARGSRPPDPTKGPYRWKASRTERSVDPLRGGVESGLGGSFTPRDPHAHPKGRGRTSRKRLHARRRVRPRGRTKRGSSDRDVRGSIALGHRGKTTPTPAREAGDGFAPGCSTQWKQRVLGDPPKRFERRETFGPLVMLRGDLRLRGASPRRKLGEEPGTREVRVRSVVRVAEVGWTHRAFFAPEDREIFRWQREER